VINEEIHIFSAAAGLLFGVILSTVVYFATIDVLGGIVDNQGHLYEKCFPNETCREFLTCDTGVYRCVEDD
jgi:hypothetical protein